MNRFSLLLISLLCFGCEDISKVEKVTTFPVQRNLVDNSGRSLEGSVLSKQAERIVFKRNSDEEMFIIPLANLSEADRAFLAPYPDQSGFSTLEKKINRSLKLKGRSAVWHRDIENAKKEAKKLDIPTVVTFLHSQEKPSQIMDRDVLNSSEFREWANGNVVLCLYYNDPDINVGLNGAGAAEGRKVASSLGVNSAPFLVILSPDGKVRKKITPKGETPKELIRQLEAEL